MILVIMLFAMIGQSAEISIWQSALIAAIFVLLPCMGFLFYFLPYLNARERRHHNATAILVLNIFLGWTFIGWVIALVWSYTKVESAQASTPVST
jgi:heme/copper-type cytochrome/quinol oxidase subunit 2